MSNHLYDDYIRKRRAYHAAGQAAKGTPANSTERAAYALAKLAYQDAGRALAASRVKT
jgi:hypothetical protein